MTTVHAEAPAETDHRYILWMLIAIAVGIIATISLYAYVKELEYRNVRSDVERGIEGLSVADTQTFLRPLLESMEGRLNALRTDVTASPQLSAKTLDRHVWKVPMYMGVTWVNLGVHQFDGAQLKLVAEVSDNRPVMVPGKSIDPDGLEQLAANKARDTGKIAIYSSTPYDTVNAERMFTRFYLPIFDDGRTPDTTPERREMLAGYVTGTIYTDLATFGKFVPESIRGIDAVFVAPGDRDLSDRLAGDPTLVWKDVVDPSTQQYSVVGAASQARTRATVSTVPSYIPAIGFFLTVGLCLLIYGHQQREVKIMRLVAERTRALDQQTQALKESERKFRMLAENVNDVLYTHDFNLTCTYISPAIYQQRGYMPSDIIGKSILVLLAETSKQPAIDGMERAKRLFKHDPGKLQGHATTTYESIRRDGSSIIVENTTSIVMDADGNPSVLGVSRDITDRVLAERRKEELENALRHTQKMDAIGTLAGGVAHDFNNLLMGILGYVDILKTQLPEHGGAIESIDVIDKAANRAKDLTSQLLGFARKGKFLSEPVNLNDSVTDVASFLYRTIDRRIELKESLSADPPVVIGDSGQIHQLLLNLAVNARDAMEDGGTLTFETRIVEVDEILARAHPGASPGLHALMIVSDTGTGISKDIQERIFEPFFTDKEPGKGTGMGLAMVYGVVASHGGIVTVYSEEGQGASFKVYLPLADEATPDVAMGVPLPLRHGTGTILVVDDEPMLRDLAAAMLGQLGYQVITAIDGLEGLKVYQQRHEEIDLMIIDMTMPRMNGVECLKAVKEVDSNVCVIMATGYSTIDLAKQTADSNVYGLLQKPFRMNELSEAVGNALARNCIRATPDL